jgi:hypothetical protein
VIYGAVDSRKGSQTVIVEVYGEPIAGLPSGSDFAAFMSYGVHA